ncbi:hypothetical protein GCM10023350_25140 [Nocardioides endophyticus]|uniref:DUF5060 domain-containing protein n=1 Tax=Nocardioides endophyticus TaxID=1353775 RepID=A0ABP8YZK4_9ACTN
MATRLVISNHQAEPVEIQWELPFCGGVLEVHAWTDPDAPTQIEFWHDDGHRFFVVLRGIDEPDARAWRWGKTDRTGVFTEENLGAPTPPNPRVELLVAHANALTTERVEHAS